MKTRRKPTGLRKIRVKRLSAAMAIFIGVVTVMPSAAAAQECTVAFPERLEGWADIEGKHYVGPLVDAVAAIFRDAGVRMSKHPVDRWPSILEKFAAGKIDILAVAVRTRTREETMQFVGPWINYRWGPFYLDGKDVTGLENPKVGVNRALKGVWPIPAYLTRLKGEPVWDTPEMLMNRLVDGEIDMVLGEYAATANRARDLNVTVKEVPDAETRLTAYMAVNKKSECVAVADRLERAIRIWKRTGGRAEMMTGVYSPD